VGKYQKKKLENVELKFKNGLVSKEEVLSQKEKYLDAQYQMFQRFVILMF